MDGGLNENDRPEDFRSGELKNENPYILKFIAYNVWGFIQAYGWVLVIIIALVLYLKSKIKLRLRADPAIEAKKYDNDVVQKQHEAMEATRLRMQMLYTKQAMAYLEQQQLLEEEKRKQRIEDWERHKAGLGYRSKYKPAEEKPEPPTENPLERARRKIFNPFDLPPASYNPLSGTSSGSSYRPPQRRTGG